MSTKKQDTIADDLLHGATAIAKFLGLDERKVYYYAEKGQLPVTRMGALIVGSKSVLRKHFTEKTTAV